MGTHAGAQRSSGLSAFGLAVVVLLAPVGARADDVGWGAGPMFAYSAEGGWSLGWEAGLSAALTLAKLNIGGAYRVSGGEQEPRAVHYLAYEPWFIVGGTLGLAAVDLKPSFVVGVWEGFPLQLQGEIFGSYDRPDEQVWLLTIAFGFRYFGGGVQQFYVTPKLYRFPSLAINS